MKIEVAAAGYEFVEIQWQAVSSSHFKPVTYSLYLDNKKVIDGLQATKYSFVNLNPGKAYTVKVEASSTDGKQVEKTITASTLIRNSGGQLPYQEYSIYSSAILMGPTSVQRLADGGHVISRVLQHSSYFGGDPFKIVVFRTNASGAIIWYRLLPTSYKSSTADELSLVTANAEKDAILFNRAQAFRIALSNGEVLTAKDYQGQLNTQFFQSAFNASAQGILVGTGDGNLLSINPSDLTINWQQTNATRLGPIFSIKVDSKKNIYYIFRDRAENAYSIQVHKCSPTGDFLASFKLDGRLAGETGGSFYMNALLIDEQDNLFVVGHTLNYSLRYLKFTTEGVVLKKGDVTDNLAAKEAFFNSKGELVVSGTTNLGSLQSYCGIYILDKNLIIKSKYIYNTIPYHIARATTVNPDGSYNIFLNYMQTYSYDNKNFVFFKTDTDGKI